jgi:hypothetical protein
MAGPVIPDRENVGPLRVFQTKSEAASLAIYWSGPPTCADGFAPCVRPEQRAPVARLFSGSPPLPVANHSPPKRSAKASASSHEVAVIAAQRVRIRRRR